MSKGLNGREEAVPATLEEALALIETERGTLREVLEEKKALESRILQAQKLESLGVVAASVTHDFNNLLHEVIGNASLARVHIEDKDACLEALRHIEGASTRAA